MKMIGLVIVPLLGAFVLLQCAAFPIGDLAASTGSRANLEASERRGRRYTDAAAAAAAASGCLAKLVSAFPRLCCIVFEYLYSASQQRRYGCVVK